MEEAEYEFGSRFNGRYSLVARKIMRMLSENSRMSNTEIAEKLGVTRQAVAKRLARLEKEFGICYTLELHEEVLGLVHPHLIMVKFGEKPDYEHIRKLLMRSHIPQFAATMKGGHDMLIYANSVSRSGYAHWDKGMQQLLAKYKVSWHVSEIAHKQLGFFPIRNETLDRVKIDDNYKRIIRFLNQDSRASFREMAKRLGMRFHVLLYNYRKLLKAGYIKRFTIVEKPVPRTVMMYYFAKLTLTDLFAQCAANARKALMYDDRYSLVSRYSFCSQLIGSGDFFVMGVFDNRKIGYRNGVLYYKSAMESQKAKMTYGIIDKVLLGRLPLRSMDEKREYLVQEWDPELAPE